MSERGRYLLPAKNSPGGSALRVPAGLPSWDDARTHHHVVFLEAGDDGLVAEIRLELKADTKARI